jgi:hypothetical protein
VVRDPLRGGFVALVDVHALNRSTENVARSAIVLECAADGVVEDEDLGCAGSSKSSAF